MKKRPRSPERIGTILESVLSAHGYLTACREHEIALRWPELVGERIAAVTECIGVEQGILTVRVTSAAWRNELVYLRETLLAAVRGKCASIRDIIFS